MLTDTGDMVFDPFGGSCVTGEVSERLVRNWTCCEIVEEYVLGAQGRFIGVEAGPAKRKDPKQYKLGNPASMWNGAGRETPRKLARDGGKQRPGSQVKPKKRKGD